ncbi:mannosyltransferase 1 [Coccidioides immitis RMSCC 3703]|uniref:Dolichyl-phosphate-mannose--protein mannosyltransferase n=1 Tax=Coccidioides immitis RMSCC 3703 TaxID=454286 RepID=A0A0J8R6K1_COCIT|nr:mannosyltransferase 1 [Coccidioides immitis RMSCC 3703]
MYPTGSKQQQITLYPHKDENNIWIMENQTQPLGSYGQVQGPHAWDNLTAGFIENGATIKLYHVTTDRRLHSHDHRPPVTEADWQNEVSAYGYEGFPGDANDLFRVEIVNSLSKGAEAKKRLRTIETKFKLVHVMSGCVLFSHPVKLPSWGFEQQEVTCAKGGSLPNSIWYVEHNEHPMFGPDVEKKNTIAGSVFFVLFLAASIATFTLFSPLAYGNPWTQDACRKVKLLSSWDFDCNTFYTDLAQYSSIANVGSSQPKATVTPPKAPAQEPAPQQQKQPQEPPQRNGQQEQQKEKEKEPAEKAEFTMPAGQRVINSEESVEYRDQDGNLLDPEQVASMAKAGNVSFKTRYETRTRVIDGQGREVKQNVAPPHPDVEGQNPETVGKDNKNIPGDKPASVPGDEKSVPQEDQKPKPASEGKEATRNADEL